MDAIRKELIRKIQTLGEVYTILSRATRLPYVICDPESFNDQVWIFESKEELEKAVKPFTDKKNPVVAIKVENKSYLSFYTTLYTLAVNAVVFYEEDKATELELEEIVKKPDFSSLPKEKQPLFNPQLQLSGIYFMQELRRGGANEEKDNLPELEEEVAANVVKSRYLMAVQRPEVHSGVDFHHAARQTQVCCRALVVVVVAAGVCLQIDDIAVAGFCAVGDFDFLMVGVKALGDLTVDKQQELRVDCIPEGHLCDKVKPQRFLVKALRHNHFCTEPIVCVRARPDVGCSVKFLPRGAVCVRLCRG